MKRKKPFKTHPRVAAAYREADNVKSSKPKTKKPTLKQVRENRSGKLIETIRQQKIRCTSIHPGFSSGFQCVLKKDHDGDHDFGEAYRNHREAHHVNSNKTTG